MTQYLFDLKLWKTNNENAVRWGLGDMIDNVLADKKFSDGQKVLILGGYGRLEGTKSNPEFLAGRQYNSVEDCIAGVAGSPNEPLSLQISANHLAVNNGRYYVGNANIWDDDGNFRDNSPFYNKHSKYNALIVLNPKEYYDFVTSTLKGAGDPNGYLQYFSVGQLP
jgi:hypothetical protein